MRLPLVSAAALLAAALPLVAPAALAQRAADAPTRLGASARLTDAPAARTGLARLVAPETFRMEQSVEFASGSAGGQGYGYGAYTNSLFWQPTGRLAARVDVGVAVPFGALAAPAFGQSAGVGRGAGLSPQVFLRNAELAYRPSRSAELRLSVQQVPSMFGGAYGYGAYGAGAYGHGASGVHTQARLGTGSDALFWRTR